MQVDLHNGCKTVVVVGMSHTCMEYLCIDSNISQYLYQHLVE